MATYKVIQDIEAEDKLVGPFSPRQFVYGLVVGGCGLVAFKLATVAWYLALPFLPPMIFFAVLAAPFGHDQPAEVWLLAKVRFFLKPKRRIWDQTGITALVKITAPPRVEVSRVKDMTLGEVRSRLKALANTIDSRGWAVKSASLNLPAAGADSDSSSDRLVGPYSLPQTVPYGDVTADDDMLDEHNSPAARQLGQMVEAASAAHRQAAINKMRGHPKTDPAKDVPADYWFMHGPVNPAASITGPGLGVFDHSSVVWPGADAAVPQAPMVPHAAEPTADEKQLLESIKQQKADTRAAFKNLHTVVPATAAQTRRNQSVASKSQASPTKALRSASTSGTGGATPALAPSPAIIQLAGNDDLDVATIARQANKQRQATGPDEVVIKLH